MTKSTKGVDAYVSLRSSALPIRQSSLATGIGYSSDKCLVRGRSVKCEQQIHSRSVAGVLDYDPKWSFATQIQVKSLCTYIKTFLTRRVMPENVERHRTQWFTK